MRQFYTIGLCLSAALLLNATIATAQAPGSVSAYGSSLGTLALASNAIKSDVSETIYIGPGNYIINGTWEIYSKYVVIDPAAVITGTGTLRFLNPSVAGGAASPTLIDGNAGTNAIAVNIELGNASGMQLQNTAFPSDLIAAGFTNNATASTLYVGANLSMTVDGANVTLGTGIVGDLHFDADATISNYGPNRMVVTNNSTLSHLVKDAYVGAFTFPVGVAAGDYTPALINNATANGIHVSVQDYVASTSDESVSLSGNGIGRTWNIYGDNASGNSTLTLQHNNSTNQSAFSDASHFVTRNGTSPNNTGDNPSLNAWQSNTPGAGTAGNLSSAGTVAGSSMRSRTFTDFAVTASAATAYYSKSSGPTTPLPVTLISFAGSAKGCSVTLSWETAHEFNMDHFDIEHSNDGRIFSTIGTVSRNNVAEENQYSFTTQQADDIANYRLSIVDRDGSTTKSAVITVRTHCLDNEPTWSVFPTPVAQSQEAAVEINTGENIDDARLIVVGILGQELMNRRLSIPSGISRYSLPVSHWAKGTYIVTLIDNKGNKIGKVNKLILK